MEVVTLHNKNQEISQFLAPSELRCYRKDQNARSIVLITIPIP